MSGPLPAVAKAVRVDFHFNQGSAANIQIREFFQYSGTLSLADASLWVVSMGTAMDTFMAALSASLVFNLIQLTDLTSNTAPQVEEPKSTAGGEDTSYLSSGAAIVLKKHIVRRYRGGHPRVYIPGTLQSWLLTPDRWSSSPLGVITTDYNTFITACEDTSGFSTVGTVTHVNISYFHGFTVSEGPTGRPKIVPTPRATPLVDTITAISANPAVASQRRRNAQGT